MTIAYAAEEGRVSVALTLAVTEGTVKEYDVKSVFYKAGSNIVLHYVKDDGATAYCNFKCVTDSDTITVSALGATFKRQVAEA